MKDDDSKKRGEYRAAAYISWSAAVGCGGFFLYLLIENGMPRTQEQVGSTLTFLVALAFTALNGFYMWKKGSTQ